MSGGRVDRPSGGEDVPIPRGVFDLLATEVFGATGGGTHCFEVTVFYHHGQSCTSLLCVDFPECNDPCPGDVNGDMLVYVNDLLAVLNSWGQACTGCPADTNGDGVVNIADLLSIIANWATPCLDPGCESITYDPTLGPGLLGCAQVEREMVSGNEAWADGDLYPQSKNPPDDDKYMISSCTPPFAKESLIGDHTAAGKVAMSGGSCGNPGCGNAARGGPGGVGDIPASVACCGCFCESRAVREPARVLCQVLHRHSPRPGALSQNGSARRKRPTSIPGPAARQHVPRAAVGHGALPGHPLPGRGPPQHMSSSDGLSPFTHLDLPRRSSTAVASKSVNPSVGREIPHKPCAHAGTV